MYQALQLKHVIWVLAGIVAIVYFSLSWWSSPASAVEWLKNVGTSVTATAGVVGVVGNKWVFQWLWRFRIVQAALFPYIAGAWTGETKSNWSVVESMRKAFVDGATPRSVSELHVDHIGDLPKTVKVTIEADLFRLRIALETLDGYSTSQSVMVRPEPRGSLTGGPQLLYFYDNRTPEGKVTDSSQHYGAAYLDIKKVGTEIIMEGTYWTARNWREGLNTAGIITLRRSA